MTTNATFPPPLPRWTLVLTGVLSLVVVLSAAALAVVAALVAPRPVWILFGFELVTLLAGVIGLFFARRRFQDGQGLALLSIAASVGVAACLTWVGTRQGVELFPGKGTVRLTALAAGRVGLAGVFALLAAYAVLRRDPRCRWYAWRAALTGLPMVLILGSLWHWRGTLGGMSITVQAIAFGAGGLLSCVLLCASVHCAIRAFECGRSPDEPEPEAA